MTRQQLDLILRAFIIAVPASIAAAFAAILAYLLVQP